MNVRSDRDKSVEARHMTTRAAKRAVLLHEWTLMVQKCQASGLPASKWCMQNSISISTYYYRLRQVRKAVLEYSELPPAKRASQPGNPVLVKVDTSFPAEEPSAFGTLPVSEVISTCEPASRSLFFRLQLNRAILDIPVGTHAEDIAEVLKAVGQNAV